MNREYNILFLSSWYPTEEDPSLGIFVKRHAKAAALYNNIAIVVAQANKDITKKKIVVNEEEGFLEIIVHYPAVKKNVPVITAFQKIIRYKKNILFGIKELIKKGFKPQLIHLNVGFPGGIGALEVQQLFKLPMILTEHWTGYLKSDGRFKKNTFQEKITKRIFYACINILPVSNNLGEALKTHQLTNKYEVVKNIVNTNVFKPTNTPKEQFLVVADLDDDQKNIQGILKVYQKLLNEHNNFPPIKFIGGGDKNNFNAVEGVQFLGLKSPEEINQELNKSFALILFSNYENLPCVIGEAFATGTPVIATKVGGVDEILNDERGILIQPKDEDALKTAILNIYSGSVNFDPNKLRQFAESNLSEVVIGKQLTDIYSKAINA